jgi:large subunit ribosomal protein L28
MGMRCANCDKGVMWGHNVSHSKRRTNRVFKPNLHAAKIVIGGHGKRVRLCTKCLRLMKSAMKLENTPKAPKVVEVAATA